jgi:hypothetical protein
VAGTEVFLSDLMGMSNSPKKLFARAILVRAHDWLMITHFNTTWGQAYGVGAHAKCD